MATEADLEHVLRNNVVEKRGPTPGEGGEWKFASSVLRQPAYPAELLAPMKALLVATLAAFARRAGVDPRFVTVVQLRGEWMKTTNVGVMPATPFAPAIEHPLTVLDAAFSMTAAGLWLQDDDFPPPVPGCRMVRLGDWGPEPPPLDADEPVTVTG